MPRTHRVTLFLRFVAATLFAAFIHSGPASALTPEEATRVGGDLTKLGNKLAKLQEAGAKVLDAAPGAYRELAAALGRIAAARSERDTTNNVWRGVLSGLLLSEGWREQHSGGLDDFKHWGRHQQRCGFFLADLQDAGLDKQARVRYHLN